MNIEEIEEKFKNLLKLNEIQGYRAERNNFGILTISLVSPCEDFGLLKASIRENDITLSCAISHTHIDVNEMKRLGHSDPLSAMINEAVDKFIGIIQEKFFVSKLIAPNGDTICTGWGPIESIDERNSDFENMLENQYGGKITNIKWVWSGKIV